MYPLGASYDGAGVNFALYSQVAQNGWNSACSTSTTTKAASK
jgi:hypothetical protein